MISETTLDRMENTTVAVMNELKRAEESFPGFNSAHEGYAVIKEELDELWHEIKNNKTEAAYERMEKEAIQLTAMGFRFLLFLCQRKELVKP